MGNVIFVIALIIVIAAFVTASVVIVKALLEDGDKAAAAEWVAEMATLKDDC